VEGNARPDLTVQAKVYVNIGLTNQRSRCEAAAESAEEPAKTILSE
jgi:hypothetical protein